jgi:hypothetical protein
VEKEGTEYELEYEYDLGNDEEVGGLETLEKAGQQSNGLID